MTIVVLGFGWVGQANALALAKQGHRVAFYDPKEPARHYEAAHRALYQRLMRLSDAREIDARDVCYIVSVGDRVSDDGVQDISLIKTALDSIRDVQGTVVLRSTILPHFLKELHFDFYVPEFLHEKHAVEECGSPHFLVIGRRTNKPEPKFLAAWEQHAYKVFRGTPEEASHIKYLSNLWNAVRIAFVNEFGDSIRTPRTQDDVASIERVVDFVFDGKFYQRYGVSFGGHCLPKDMRAYIWEQSLKGKRMPLLEGAYAANLAHKEFESAGTLTEWFSAWQKPALSGRAALSALGAAIKRRLSSACVRA